MEAGVQRIALAEAALEAVAPILQSELRKTRQERHRLARQVQQRAEEIIAQEQRRVRRNRSVAALLFTSPF